MNRFDQDWQKLVALARQAPPSADEPMLPPGFATRVAALAATTPPAPWGGLERFALRGFVAATACCAAAVAYSYFGHSTDISDESELDDSVTEFVALS
jgi:hypothetical protein